jgi:hypothetical protein
LGGGRFDEPEMPRNATVLTPEVSKTTAGWKMVLPPLTI